MYWFAIENLCAAFYLPHRFAIAYPNFPHRFAYANLLARGACGRETKKQNPERAQSVGEGEGTHSRNDTVVLPRQAQNERGGSMRGMQGAYRIRALPSRKVPVQGQQKILFLL